MKRFQMVLCCSPVDALSVFTISQSDRMKQFIHICAVVTRPLLKYCEAYNAFICLQIYSHVTIL